jgi:hypothetical protein
MMIERHPGQADGEAGQDHPDDNPGDEFGRLIALLEDAIRELCQDPRRLYAGSAQGDDDCIADWNYSAGH